MTELTFILFFYLKILMNLIDWQKKQQKVCPVGGSNS